MVVDFLINNRTFLYDWQTLIGSLSGSILGVAGSLFVASIGFLLNHFYQRYKEIRENIRLAEINLAWGLNDIFDIERHLNDFLKRLNQVTISPLKNNPSTSQYFLSETNFPILSINFDLSLSNSKYNSYYVHNKILIIIKNVKMLNDNFQEIKIKYEGIVEKAKFLIQQGATPTNQQKEYLSNNESFELFVKDIISQLQIAKKIFAETKIYNLKLLKKQYFLIWCLEGASFKIFLNRNNIETYKSTLYCLDRIDQVISSEVDNIMRDVKNRAQDLKPVGRKYIGDNLYYIAQKIMQRLKF